MTDNSTRCSDIIDHIKAIRKFDAPTHGGKVLSYVYDSGLPELDELAARAAWEVQTINGLDPTTFPSIAVMERDLLGFVRDLLHGDDDVYGNVTTGGTESCLLAIKTARDVWRARNKDKGPYAIGRIVAPSTVHAATHKAASYFDLELDLVPVDPSTGAVDPQDVIDRLDDDVALVVLSAPNYPYAQLDPIAEIAPHALEKDIALHVDACIGGLALPWWEGLDEAWDFAVPGVTSISADLHKFGYAPKGISILLQRGALRHRAQYFSVIGWPGYPVVNPTLLGSKSAGPIAAAWAIVSYLGYEGYRELTATTQVATAALIDGFNAIEGLRVQGTPTGPLFAVVTDESIPPERRVDAHLLVDDMRASGWILQSQPYCPQEGGEDLPRSAHLTITPVIKDKVEELLDAARASAEKLRGVDGPHKDIRVTQASQALLGALERFGVGESGQGISQVSAEAIQSILGSLGVDSDSGSLPQDMSGLLALAEKLPDAVARRLLTEILALVVRPVDNAFGPAHSAK